MVELILAAIVVTVVITAAICQVARWLTTLYVNSRW